MYYIKERKTIKKLIAALSAVLIIFSSTASSLILSISADENIKPSEMFQDFNSFTGLGTGAAVANGNGTMTGDGYALNGSSAKAQFLIDDSNSYENGGKSLKYEGLQQSWAGDNDTAIRLYEPVEKGSLTKAKLVPEGSTGFSFWLRNSSSSNFTLNIYSQTLYNSWETTNYRWARQFLTTEAAGEWVKYTVRFDDFRNKTDTWGSGGAETSPPRSYWDEVLCLQMRVGPGTSADVSFNLDNIEWIFDNEIVNFEDAVLGSGAGQIQVTANAYELAGNSPAGTVAEIVDSGNAAIDSAESFLSDKGKSLKIDLGTIATVNTDSGADLNNTNPWIKINIPMDNINLSGSGLRLWTRNDSGSALQMRFSITSDKAYRQGDGSTNLSVTQGTARSSAHSHIAILPYSNFRHYLYGIDGIGGYGGATAAPLTVNQLQGVKSIQIYLFPRVSNSGGTVYIDGITVRDSLDIPALDEAVSDAQAVNDDGIYILPEGFADALADAAAIYEAQSHTVTQAYFTEKLGALRELVGAVTPKPFNITYNNIEGASWQTTAPSDYTSANGVTLPGANDIKKPYFTFMGWYDNADLTGEPVASIPAGSTGAKSFWASWRDDNAVLDEIIKALLKKSDVNEEIIEAYTGEDIENLTIANLLELKQYILTENP